MQRRYPRSRISPLRCAVWPIIAGLARAMGPGHAVFERRPEQHVAGLFVQRQIGPIVAVDEKCRGVSWNKRQLRRKSKVFAMAFGRFRPANSPHTRPRSHAAELQPVVQQVAPSLTDRKHHFIVVAQERNQAGTAGQAPSSVHHAAHIRPAINIIAQRNERVLRLRSDCLQQRFQRRQAAVDVADRDGAGCHEGGRGESGFEQRDYSLATNPRRDHPPLQGAMSRGLPGPGQSDISLTCFCGPIRI